MKRDCEQIVARVLQAGAWGSFALIAAGLAADLAAPAVGSWLVKAGMVLLLATPVLRIVAALICFLQEGDRKYALVSLGVLAIVVAASLAAVPVGH